MCRVRDLGCRRLIRACGCCHCPRRSRISSACHRRVESHTKDSPVFAAVATAVFADADAAADEAAAEATARLRITWKSASRPQAETDRAPPTATAAKSVAVDRISSRGRVECNGTRARAEWRRVCRNRNRLKSNLAPFSQVLRTESLLACDLLRVVVRVADSHFARKKLSSATEQRGKQESSAGTRESCIRLATFKLSARQSSDNDSSDSHCPCLTSESSSTIPRRAALTLDRAEFSSATKLANYFEKLRGYFFLIESSSAENSRTDQDLTGSTWRFTIRVVAEPRTLRNPVLPQFPPPPLPSLSARRGRCLA